MKSGPVLLPLMARYKRIALTRQMVLSVAPMKILTPFLNKSVLTASELPAVNLDFLCYQLQCPEGISGRMNHIIFHLGL